MKYNGPSINAHLSATLTDLFTVAIFFKSRRTVCVYIYCSLNLSTTTTSPQRQRPLNRVPTSKKPLDNGQLISDGQTVYTKPQFLLVKITQLDPYDASLVSVSVLLMHFDCVAYSW